METLDQLRLMISQHVHLYRVFYAQKVWQFNWLLCQLVTFSWLPSYHYLAESSQISLHWSLEQAHHSL